MRYRAALLLLLLPALAGAQDITAGKLLLSDNFDRFTESTSDLGKLPDTDYRWAKRIPTLDGKLAEGHVSAGRGLVYVAYSSGHNPCDTGLAVAGFTVADAVISLTIGPSYMENRAHTGIVSYRAKDVQSAAGGMTGDAYHVEVAPDWAGSRDVVLRYGGERLATADVAPARALQEPHRLRIAFAGDRHQVWLDDKPLIDYWNIDAGRAGAGHVGFGGNYSIGPFDDFALHEAIPGAPTPPANAGGLGPLLFQGRPFFAVGTYNPPDEVDEAEWLGAGCNTVVLNPPAPTSQPADRWPTKHGLAAIYFPTVPLFSHADGKNTVTRPAEVPAKVAQLKEMLAVTANDPQTLGYCTFDEPENDVYPAYTEWDQKKDVGLAQWIAGGMKWTFDTLKAGDPDAYVMPIVAWWTTYKDLAPIYDVNFPNHYPTLQKDAPLTGALHEVVMDAALAADAARATKRVGFVYMPGIFDTMPGQWRAATLAELRHTCFAPITQGALGVIPWRLGYCSLPYRRSVVYPIMRELSLLRPWFLGEWCDDEVMSDHDTATVEYLRKLPKRVRLIEGEEKAETVATDVVPDCSHCLRRRPDNTYLLLAVSNRREPITVTFTLKDIAGLPETALETLQYARTPIANNTIKDTLEPFGVRAWIIEPK